MARFGDIARIQPQGRNIELTLKSGSVFLLNRYAADDLADGVTVWDRTHGVVDLDEMEIRSIEFLPGTTNGTGPTPLYGTVRTQQGEFTGLIQWNREECLGSDELNGFGSDGEMSLPYDNIRSIARRSRDTSLVTLADGREVSLTGSSEVGRGNRGVYVDDSRYGRVLVSWDAFLRVDFSAAGSGPAYSDFPPGRALSGTVTTRTGKRLAGRLVYDLDESETTETLDAPLQGVDYTIPFALVATILLPNQAQPGDRRATITLHSGESLRLERAGDLGDGNAGILVFVDGAAQAEFVRWENISQIDFVNSK
jgi:hypothetical protein